MVGSSVVEIPVLLAVVTSEYVAFPLPLSLFCDSLCGVFSLPMMEFHTLDWLFTYIKFDNATYFFFF
jgi:hypothetical protein